LGTATIGKDPTTTAVGRTLAYSGHHAEPWATSYHWNWPTHTPWTSSGKTDPTPPLASTTTTQDPPPPSTTTTQDPPTTTTTSTTLTPPPSGVDLATNPSGAAVPGPVPGWTETFTDNFTSPSTLSNYQDYGFYAPDGSESCLAPDHTSVIDGMLVIKAYKDPAAVAAEGCTGTANGIVTGGVKLNLSQTYGKYEVRMKVANGEGVSMVDLLWPTGDTWPPEIDFAEDGGEAPRSEILGTEHWGTAADPSQITTPVAVDMTQWQTVGVEWSPGKIVYTLNGADWATETNANVSSVPMQMAMQTQAWQCGTNDNNSFEQCANSTTPAEVDMDVDWIAVYSLNS
jgi:beta-glucanase (GH16 family)